MSPSLPAAAKRPSCCVITTKGAHPLTHARNVVWLVDAAFIGTGFGDCSKRNPASTMSTGMESRLRVDSTG